MTSGRALLLRQIALSAGGQLLRYFGKIGLSHARFKKNEPTNLVSLADTQTQSFIVQAIGRCFPNDLILAEEGDLSRTLKPDARRGFVWVIDPLDGTVNFLHGFPMFAVSIAVCYNEEPCLGAIYAPAFGEFFWAQKAKGAYFQKIPELLKPQAKGGSMKLLKVSVTSRLKNSLLLTGFGYDRAKRAAFYLSFVKDFMERCHDVRRCGAACIDLAWLAAGRYDGFWEWMLHPWDVACGILLVREAGGRVSHFSEGPYSIFRSEQTLASNGKIHRELLAVIQARLKQQAQAQARK